MALLEVYQWSFLAKKIIDFNGGSLSNIETPEVTMDFHTTVMVILDSLIMTWSYPHRKTDTSSEVCWSKKASKQHL